MLDVISDVPRLNFVPIIFPFIVSTLQLYYCDNVSIINLIGSQQVKITVCLKLQWLYILFITVHVHRQHTTVKIHSTVCCDIFASINSVKIIAFHYAAYSYVLPIGYICIHVIPLPMFVNAVHILR